METKIGPPQSVRLSEWLGVFSEGEKVINVFLEVVLVAMGVVMFESRSVRRSTNALVRYVLPIVLLVNGSAVLAQVIHAPRLFEGGDVFFRHEDPEFFNGSLHNWELSIQHVNDGGIAIVWPINWNWIKPNEDLMDGASERSAGGGVSVFSVTVHSEPVKDDPCNSRSGGTKKPDSACIKRDSEEIHNAFWMSFGLFMASNFIAMSLHLWRPVATGCGLKTPNV